MSCQDIELVKQCILDLKYVPNVAPCINGLLVIHEVYFDLQNLSQKYNKDINLCEACYNLHDYVYKSWCLDIHVKGSDVFKLDKVIINLQEFLDNLLHHF